MISGHTPSEDDMTQKELLARHGETVRQVFCSLLGALPSPRALSELTGTPEQDWLADYLYGGDLPGENMPRRISLFSRLSCSAGAIRLFTGLNGDKGLFFESLHLAACGRELEAVETLFLLADRLQGKVGPESINTLTLLAMRCLLGLHVDRATPGFVRRYLSLCSRLFPLLVGCGCQTPSPALIFLRACGLAKLEGDRKLAAFFELMTGATNMCNHSGHNSARRHAVMHHGRNELLATADPEDLLNASPYFGIWHFMEGEYREAMREFQLASPQLRKDGQTMLELFCLRHWCFSAFNLGLFEFSEHQLQYRLRQFSPRHDNQLARTIRGQLAGCFLRTGKLENALEHLDTAQSGISPRNDIVSWMTNSRHLAYYHLLSGRIDNAYHIFRSAAETARQQNYERPLYMSCVVLDLLYAFHRHGYPPLPCYDLAGEIKHCLRGPSRLLKGIAYRVLGELRRDAQRTEEAAALFKKSLKELHGVSVLEQSKTHLRLAALYLDADKKRAVVHALHAWPQHDDLRYFWSRELEELIPSHFRDREHDGLSAKKLLTLYRDNLQNIPPCADGTTFALNMLISSCHILGAAYGFLFAPGKQDSSPRLLASTGPEGSYAPELESMSFQDFIHLVQDGTPQIFDYALNPLRPNEGGRMIIGIPIEDGQDGYYVLCHDHLNDPDIRYLLTTDILEELGELAGKILNRNLFGPNAPAIPSKRRKLSLSEHAEIISASPSMKNVLDRADAIADTDASVLIAGESGVGKELVARRLHERSGRTGAMISLNMAGMTDNLLASELFGHEKGAFTGAQSAKPGLVELARNGTLFLDEITEASAGVQATLLRLLENRQFYRVGGTSPVSVEFRLVAASNRNLKQAVTEGTFRHDLYYRISSIVLQVPPLRGRPEDITALAFYYLHYFASRHGRACVTKFSRENMEKLLGYRWPGNVRELKNVVEQSVLFSSGQTVELEPGLPAPEETVQAIQTSSPAPAGQSASPHPLALLSDFPSLAEMEKRYIRMVLDMTGGRINGASGALDILKMNRSTLYTRLREYGIK